MRNSNRFSFTSSIKTGLRHGLTLGCILFLMLLLASVSSLAQTTIRVPADQATIQAAINAASAGDTVLVSPGTYYENIDFKGKAITVTSESGASVTTINGGGVATVVTFKTNETSASVISGFTITNGYSDSYLPSLGQGAGIFISGASPRILNNEITGNNGCGGIGVYVYKGAPLIQGNSINNNAQTSCSGGDGGGIGISGSSGVIQILDNLIQNNHVDHGGSGGGIDLISAGPVLIRGNIISGNSTYNSGAGISVGYYSNPQVIGNLIVGNRVVGGYMGGGIYYVVGSGPAPLILGNTIAGNSASRGAAIYSDGHDQKAQILNNVIVASWGVPALACDADYDSFPPILQYNDVYSGGTTPSSGNCGSFIGSNGNISVDPLFVAADVTNYHLQPASPVIDLGSGSFSGIPALDLAGFARILDGNGDGVAAIDLGAYEYAGKTTSTISTSSIRFGDVQKVGTTSAAVVVTVSNTGDKTLDVSTIGIVGDFTQTNTCRVAGGISAGKNCTISFAFRPTVRGARSGTATIVSNSTSSPQTITLQGTANAPIISVEPTSLTFGDQALRTTSAAQVVTIRNTGDGSLVISSIATTGDFAVSHTCGTVMPGGSCTAAVTFTPQATRTRVGSLAIIHDAAGSPSYVSLAGNGLGPEITFSRGSILFPNQPVGTLSNPVALTVSNTGTLPLTISAVQITGDYQQTNNCVGTLQPGASCQAAVSFKPTYVGARTGSISFSDNAAASPHTVALSGTATGPIASVSWNGTFPITFPNTVVGAQSVTVPITLGNVGNETLQISGISTTSDFSQVNNCGAMLSPSSSCTISVAFKPTATGTRSGSLQLAYNAAGSPLSLPLSGYALAVYPVPVVASVSQSVVRIGTSATLTVTGSNFFPASVVYWGEQPLATTFNGDTSLTATVPASLVTDYGEYKVSVRSPSPGGGSSAQSSVTAYASIPASVREIVYDPNRRLLYASTTSPNAILVIDPATRQTSSIALNSDPNKLALSDDGQFLYVGLDGAGALARVSLPAGTIDFQLSLGLDPSMGMRTAQDIKVLPGNAHAYVVSLACKGYSPKSAGIIVYDDQTPRPKTIASAMFSSVHGNSLLFMNNDPTVLYGSDIDISDYSFYRFTINASGIALTDSTLSLGGGALACDGLLLYESYGRIVDPIRPAQVGTYSPQFGGYFGSVLPEAGSQRLFASEWAYINSVATNVLEVADLHALSSLGYLKVPRTNSADIKTILRWGDNGIALRVGTQEIMLLRTALTGTPLATTPAPAPTVTTLSPDSAPQSTAGLTITVTGNDFQPWSIVRWNGSNRQTTYVNATTLTATLTASDLASVGTAQITVFTPTPGGGTSAAHEFSIINLSLFPSSLTFPATMVGYGTGYQKVTFTNSSPAALAVTPTVSGPFLLRYNLCPAIVAPGASCNLMVLYLPQAGGPESGTLSVSYTGGAVPVTAALNGTGIAKIVVGSNALTFAPTDISSGAGAQKIGITNRTGKDITITPVIDTAIAGTFRIATNGCMGTIAPNNGCYLWVNYIATYPGEQTGTLTITPSTGAVETVSLTGTGNPGQIIVGPTAVTYAATKVGYGAGAQKVGILNRTGADITIAYAIDTPIAGSFRVSTNGCGGTLAPNTGCYLWVNYIATATGQQNGTLTITPTGGGTVKSVSLTGTGN